MEGGGDREGICQEYEARCCPDEWGSGRDVGILDMCLAAGLSAPLVGNERKRDVGSNGDGGEGGDDAADLGCAGAAGLSGG